MDTTYMGMGSPAVSSSVPSSQNLQLPQDQFSPSRRRAQAGSVPTSPQPSLSQVLPTSPLQNYQHSQYFPNPQHNPSFPYGQSSYSYLYPTSHPASTSVRSPSSSRRRNSSQSPDRSSIDNGRSYRNSNSNSNWTRGRGKSSGVSRRQPPFNHSQSKHQQQSQYTYRQEEEQYGTETAMDYQGRSSRAGYPSSSVPSTPHLPKNMTRHTSQTPSPNRGKGSSPKSISSEPAKTQRLDAWSREPCRFEIAMLTAKRRMPYSIGVERLPREENAVREKLTAEEEKDLTGQIMRLVEEKLQPNSDVELRRRRFLEKLERIFNTVWPGHDIQVRAFGSTENKLSSKESDIDVCIKTPWDGLNSMCKIASEMDKAGMQRVICVMAAKVPIVKIWDPEFQVQCDMNVNNTGALENTRMIKTYVEIDPRVRPLAMTIKYWTKMRVLNDAAGGGTLSSYTWTCMILNFLQTRDPPILPSLHKRLSTPKVSEAGDVIAFDDNLDELRGYGENNKETLGGLLYGFFRHYGYEYDWDESVISVREGKLLSKKGSSWYLMQNNRLCVEEPFNTSRNLGNTADDTSIRGLHLELRRACEILEKSQSFDECCLKYEFPDQKSTITSTSTSTRGGRGGYSGRGRTTNTGYAPRQPSTNNNKNSSGNNRRPNNVGQYPNPQMHQAQPMYPDYYYAVPAGPDFHLALQQIQQQALAQQQYRHYQQHGMNSNSSTQDNYQALAGLHQLMPFNAYSSLIGLPSYYYQQLQQQQQQQQQHQQHQHQHHHQMSQADSQGTASVPASPPVATTMPDARGMARASRQLNGYNSTVRSRSQPPTTTNGYPVSGRPLVTNAQPLPSLNIGVSDDDLECVELSSNGSTNNIVPPLPETPPDTEVSVEYAGFYTFGGPFQHGPLATQPVDTESFMNSRDHNDKNKTSSTENTTPKLDTRTTTRNEPHRIPVVLGLEQLDSQVPPSQTKTALPVSPSTSSTTVTHHSVKETPIIGPTVAETTMGGPEKSPVSQKGRKANETNQKKVEEQSRESSASVPSPGSKTSGKPSVPSITVPQSTNPEAKTEKKGPRSPKTKSPKTKSPSQSSPSKGKSKKSPQMALWINDDAKTTLSPVVEVQTPPLETPKSKAEERRVDSQPHPAPKQEKPHKATNKANAVERSVEHQPPPTPADLPTKSGNNHHRYHRHHHTKSTNSNSHKGGSEATKDTKEDGDKKSTRPKSNYHSYKKAGRPKKRAASGTATGEGGSKVPINESERKGG